VLAAPLTRHLTWDFLVTEPQSGSSKHWNSAPPSPGGAFLWSRDRLWPWPEMSMLWPGRSIQSRCKGRSSGTTRGAKSYRGLLGGASPWEVGRPNPAPVCGSPVFGRSSIGRRCWPRRAYAWGRPRRDAVLHTTGDGGNLVAGRIPTSQVGAALASKAVRHAGRGCASHIRAQDVRQEQVETPDCRCGQFLIPAMFSELAASSTTVPRP
jgi:hypothetical protein